MRESETAAPNDEPEVPARPFHHPLCKVCNSPDRNKIEIALLLGESGPSIGERFPDDKFNRTNLSTYRNRHMEMVDAVVADAVRVQTAQSRRDAEDAGEAVVGRLRLVEDLLTAGLAAAQAGRVPYSIRDILSLSDERERLAGQERSYEQLENEFRAFNHAVLEVVPESMRPHIWEAFEAKWGVIHGVE
jgi:hypothetical protein